MAGSPRELLVACIDTVGNAKLAGLANQKLEALADYNTKGFTFRDTIQ